MTPDQRSTRDAIAYLCAKISAQGDIYSDTLARLLYLADWRSAMALRHQVTGLHWRDPEAAKTHEAILSALSDDPDFALQPDSPDGLGISVHVSLKRPTHVRLDADAQQVLDYVIFKTRNLDDEALSDLVFSTFPVVTTPGGGEFDLVELAVEYLAENPEVEAENAAEARMSGMHAPLAAD